MRGRPVERLAGSHRNSHAAVAHGRDAAASRGTAQRRSTPTVGGSGWALCGWRRAESGAVVCPSAERRTPAARGERRTPSDAICQSSRSFQGRQRNADGEFALRRVGARWHEGRSENRRETAKRDRKRRTPKGGRRLAHHTPLLKIPVWWRRAVLPSLPCLSCWAFFLSFLS